jgi:hypothetical protein
VHNASQRDILSPVDDLTARRARLCRLEPEHALSSLEEADGWIRERGLVEVTRCCSLPSLHVAVHEPPYKPGSRGFGLYPATKWWWAGELSTRDGLHALKIHGSKTVLVTTEIAQLAGDPARAALAEADAGQVGALEQRLVRHLATAGPGEVRDLRAELGAESRPFRAARERLERVGAIVATSLQLEPHSHSSLLSRWDQVFPVETSGGLDGLLVAFVRAAVVAPEREVVQWLSWSLPADTVERLVQAGRLLRVDGTMVAAAEV